MKNILVINTGCDQPRRGLAKHVAARVNPTPDPSPRGRGAATYTVDYTIYPCQASKKAVNSTAPLPLGEGSGVGLTRRIICAAKAQRYRGWAQLAIICLLLAAAIRLPAQCAPDKIPPYLAPKANTTVTLGGPRCTAVVKPAQLLNAYADNCTAPDELTLRLRRVGVSTGFPLLPGGLQLTLTPADMGAPVFVEVWARDQAGNTAYVFAGITVENPGGCSFALLPDTLWANVGLLHGNGVDDLTWLLDEKLPTGVVLNSFVTDGRIFLPENLFAGPAQDNTVIVTPQKINDPLNGVSTFDIVLMTKAILELEPLANPYKYLAADVNRDGKVSMLDALEVRRLILGIYTELPDNRSWRFIPDDYIFPMPENPFYEEVPESVSFDRHHPRPLPNFIPIKVGDLNGNAVTSNFAPPAESRTAASLRLPDQTLTPGQRILLPVTIPNVRPLFGLQGAFVFNPAQLRISGIIPHALSEFSTENYFQPEPGLLNFSWTDLEQLGRRTGDTLFFLEIETLQACRLSQALRLHTGRLEAEAYTANGAIAALQLDFAPLPLPAADRVGAVFPNPASGVLYTPVELVEAARVSLELFDAGGRRVYFLEKNLPAGPGLLEAPLGGLPNGMLNYRVSAGRAIGRGVVIRN